MNHNISNVGVTPHFPIGQNVLKKYWEKIKIDLIDWENFSHEAKPIEKNINKRLTQSIENTLSIGQNLSKKCWEKENIDKTIYWGKVNIDTFSSEKLFS